MAAVVPGPRRHRTTGVTVEVTIGGEPAVLTTGNAADGTLCRVDLRAGVHGSMLAGLAEALAAAITLGLQRGAPAAEYAPVLGLALDGDAGHSQLLLAGVTTAGADR